MSEEQRYKELNGMTVEYDLVIGGVRENAVGIFMVDGNEDFGNQSLSIHREYEISLGSGRFAAVDIPVHQNAIPAILPHPDPAVARYLLRI